MTSNLLTEGNDLPEDESLKRAFELAFPKGLSRKLLPQAMISFSGSIVWAYIVCSCSFTPFARKVGGRDQGSMDHGGGASVGRRRRLERSEAGARIRCSAALQGAAAALDYSENRSRYQGPGLRVRGRLPKALEEVGGASCTSEARLSPTTQPRPTAAPGRGWIGALMWRLARDWAPLREFLAGWFKRAPAPRGGLSARMVFCRVRSRFMICRRSLVTCGGVELNQGPVEGDIRAFLRSQGDGGGGTGGGGW